MRRFRLPSVRQLDLLFGRLVTLPDGELFDGRPIDLEHYDATEGAITRIPELVELTPNQARWMGVEVPSRPGCPGCVLFGTCAMHDEREE